MSGGAAACKHTRLYCCQASSYQCQQCGAHLVQHRTLARGLALVSYTPDTRPGRPLRQSGPQS